MKLLLLVFLLGAALVAAAKPTVFLIRHGEKPFDDDDPSLSPEGEERAECVRELFGPRSRFNIGHIMAQRPKASGRRQRPYQTVAPLADDLGLTVDVSCGKKDVDCVRDVVEDYQGHGNILICWEHKRLRDIAEALGARHVEKYPKHAYDLIWVDPYPYDDITDVLYEDCPRLDRESTLHEQL